MSAHPRGHTWLVVARRPNTCTRFPLLEQRVEVRAKSRTWAVRRAKAKCGRWWTKRTEIVFIAPMYMVRRGWTGMV